MFCRKCGTQIPDDSEFCYKCGTRVTVNVSETATDKPITVEKPLKQEQKASVSLEKTTAPVSDNKGNAPTPDTSENGSKQAAAKIETAVSNDGAQSRYKKALAVLEHSNDIDSLQRASDEFLALGAYLDSRKKSRRCMDKIYKIQNNISTAAPRYGEQASN